MSFDSIGEAKDEIVAAINKCFVDVAVDLIDYPCHNGYFLSCSLRSPVVTVTDSLTVVRCKVGMILYPERLIFSPERKALTVGGD